MSDLRKPMQMDGPAAVIAAIPWLLGFFPTQSAILVLVKDGELLCALRADLADVMLAPEEFARHTEPTHADAAIVVLVDDLVTAHGVACPTCADARAELVDALGKGLGANGIELYGAYVVDRIEVGGRWSCFDRCGDGGLIDDPATSPAAADAKAAGRIVYASRAAAMAPVTGTDPARSARLAGLIGTTRTTTGEPLTSEQAGIAVTRAIATVRSVADGGVLDDVDAAQLALALLDPQVRDALLGLAISVDAGAATALWMQMSQILPEPWRADALAMAAFSMYLAGDGPRAMEALDEALRIEPGHRLAGMLTDALAAGIRPEALCVLAMTGYRIGERLGTDYPALADNAMAATGV